MEKLTNKKVYPEQRRRVFVGMSGGVDSSVAAYLLKQATPNNFSKLFGRPTPEGFRGYDVTGVFIRSFNVDGCAERDAEDARRAAAHLGIPFYSFDFEEEYKKSVVDYMVEGYRNGLTPNPDVMCNKEIKFGLFLERALEIGADYIATGHYVRLALRHIPRGSDRLFAPAAKSGLDSRRVRSAGDQAERASETFRSKHAGELASFYLTEAKDKNKDQTYFLWTLTQEQLKHCLFPIGDYLKGEVREIARKAGLPTAEKKDSQGICFLGDVALDEFLKDYIKPKKGPIVDTDGNKVGEHMGAQFYTIGQRHLGAKIQIPNTKFQKPFYVVSKDIKTNTLVVAEGDDNPALFKKEIEITDVHFIDGELRIKNYELGMPVMARVRYRQPLVPAKLIFTDAERITTDNNQRKSVPKSAAIRLVFSKPVKFVAPGQSAVFYEAGFLAGLRGRRMLGGGIIK